MPISRKSPGAQAALLADDEKSLDAALYVWSPDWLWLQQEHQQVVCRTPRLPLRGATEGQDRDSSGHRPVCSEKPPLTNAFFFVERTSGLPIQEDATAPSHDGVRRRWGISGISRGDRPA